MWCHWLYVPSFLIAMSLADFATSAIHWDEMWVKHTWNDVPANWESLGNTTAGAIINLHIALKPDRESALIDALSEVSDPAHPRYGAYLSKEQVAELVSPHPHTLELVRAWLVHHGIRSSSISMSHGGSWVTVTDVLVSQANHFLNASYQLYRNSKTNDTIIRTVGYALPTILHTHIQTVAPTTHFPSARGMWHSPRKRSFGETSAQLQGASGKSVMARLDPGITPSFLRWAYKAVSYRPAVPYENTLGILGIDDDYPSKLDLTHFLTRFRYEARDVDFTVMRLNGGGYNPSNPNSTASIGVQYATAIAYPTEVIFYSVGGDTLWNRTGHPVVGDMYLVWLNKLLREQFPPQTISIGYGQAERELPWEYASSLCILFAQLGLRGITVLAASGMDGVGAGNCTNADGDVEFTPEFPSSCPFVTSVGGTTNFRPETAANLSGGGFSFYFQTPEYQVGAVLQYLELYRELYDGLYNPNGRGYPDISAQALDYNLVMNGERLYMDGTACSVSTVAGIVSLINDHRIVERRPTLGFLNPLLYSRGVSGIKDIQFGRNPGCNTPGFLADVGWDPVTGLGALELEGMLEN